MTKSTMVSRTSDRTVATMVALDIT
jgi:hypothetical protein